MLHRAVQRLCTVVQHRSAAMSHWWCNSGCAQWLCTAAQRCIAVYRPCTAVPVYTRLYTGVHGLYRCYTGLHSGAQHCQVVIPGTPLTPPQTPPPHRSAHGESAPDQHLLNHPRKHRGLACMHSGISHRGSGLCRTQDRGCQTTHDACATQDHVILGCACVSGGVHSVQACTGLYSGTAVYTGVHTVCTVTDGDPGGAQPLSPVSAQVRTALRHSG